MVAVRLRRHVTVVAALVVLVAALPGSVAASHSWNGYHWARAEQSFTLELGDDTTTAEWSDLLGAASADWSASRILDTVVAAGQTTDPPACRPTLGRVEVCNGTYGANQHWIGIAQIWIDPNKHIVQGTVRNNDSYLSNPDRYPSLATSAWKRFVACQEVGHTFGLDHQDEAFDNANLGTCMDYTDDPDGTLLGQASNVSPNRHDYQELTTVYRHLDDYTTVGAAGAAASGSYTPKWDGQRGVAQVIETKLAGGGRLVTWVLWAP